MVNFVSNEFKAMLGDLQFVAATFGKLGSFGRNIGMVPIDEFARYQVWLHVVLPPLRR